MSDYLVEPIRRMGSDGALVASGVRWTETRSIVVKLLAVPMFAAIMTMFLTGLVMLAKGFPRVRAPEYGDQGFRLMATTASDR